MLPALAWLRRTEDDVSAEEERAIAQRPSDDLRLDLARALESLPAIYREVILLRDMEQLTIGETAERLEITREATKSRLHRARELVREYLKGWGAERGMDAGSGPA
jgi:RNA polymerase sigma factor (sigma-70 family)